jgi:hypothetical protein
LEEKRKNKSTAAKTDIRKNDSKNNIDRSIWR